MRLGRGLSIPEMALRRTSSGIPTPTPGPITAPTVMPDLAWTGSAGQVAAPAMDTSLQGSGCLFSASGSIAEHEEVWIGYDDIENVLDHYITVDAEHSDAAGIKEVRVAMESGTWTVLTVQSWNARTSTAGFNFLPQSRSGQNGEAIITVDIVPFNGYIKRFTRRVTLNTSLTGRLTRPVRYLSTSGSDSADGSLATPWKTVSGAAAKMTDAAFKGGIVKMAAGAYVENDNNWTQNSNTRAFTFMPADGVAGTDVVISWQDRALNSGGRGAGVWQVKALKVEFYNIDYETSNCVQYWPAQSASCRHTFRKCRIYDVNGAGGPVDSSDAWAKGGTLSNEAPMYGTGYYGSPSQSFFKQSDGQRIAAVECSYDMYVFTNLAYARNVSGTASYDVLYLAAVAGGGDWDKVWYHNVDFTIDLPYVQRGHVESYLTVATAVFDGSGATGGTAGNTIITVQGSPTLSGPYQDIPFTAYKFLTGANVGRSSGSGSSDESLGYGGFHTTMQNRNGVGITLSAGSANMSSALHRLRPNTPITFSGTLPPELVAGQTYYVLSSGFSINVIQVSATLGGAAIVPSATGSGVQWSASNVIIVNGDCSTATGGTAVGDRIRGYQIAHCDIVQFAATSTTKDNLRDLYLSGYRVHGPAVGNLGLMDVGASVYPSSGTVSTSGTAFTTTATETIWPDDHLKVTSGARKNESRRIVSYDQGTKTGVLASAFTTDLPASTPFGVCRSIVNLTIKNCYWGTYANGSFLQWGGALTNVIITGSTIIGRPDAPTSNVGDLAYRVLYQNTPPGKTCVDGLVVEDSILESVVLDSIGGGALPSTSNAWEHVRVTNSTVRRGSAFNGSSVTAVTFDVTSGLPTFPGAIQTASRQNWAFTAPDGPERKRDATSPIGAVIPATGGGGGTPANALTIGGDTATLAGDILTLGA